MHVTFITIHVTVLDISKTLTFGCVRLKLQVNEGKLAEKKVQVVAI